MVIWAIVLGDSKKVGFPLPLMIITFDDSINLIRNPIFKNKDVGIETMLGNMTCSLQI